MSGAASCGIPDRGGSGTGVDAVPRAERPGHKQRPDDTDQMDRAGLRMEGETASRRPRLAGHMEGHGIRDL